MAVTEEEAAWEGARAAGATSKEAKFAIWAGRYYQRTTTSSKSVRAEQKPPARSCNY